MIEVVGRTVMLIQSKETDGLSCCAFLDWVEDSPWKPVSVLLLNTRESVDMKFSSRTSTEAGALEWLEETLMQSVDRSVPLKAHPVERSD